MKDTRTINSIKNSVVSIFAYIVPTIIAFVAQAVFIRALNTEYNGIKSLFNNILGMLSIAELGFGSAIIYHLYEPMAKKEYDKIKILLKFYKKVYNFVAITIFILGIILLPLIPNIVGEVTIFENVKFIFILYLFNTVFSYLLTYKRSILHADQKAYIVKLINCFFVIIRNLIQIAVIIFTKNFIYYIIVQILLTIIENISINMYVNKKYEYIKDLKTVENIPKELRDDIIFKVKGLLYHKIGSFIVTGTDNIIVSMTKELGVITVGIYSNYNMIIHRVAVLFSNVITSLTASVGNLLVEKNIEKSKNIYKSMLLLNSWIFCFCSTSVLCMVEPFIKIWLGDGYLLEKIVLYTLIINMYIQGLKKTNTTFKDAAGIFYEDRFVPIIEAIINIVASLILLKIFGLAGVFMGTIVSTMVLFLYSFPKYVYVLLLKGTYLEYIKLYLKYIVISVVIGIITAYLSSFIIIENTYLNLLCNGILCLIVPNILYFIVVRKFPEFEFYNDKLKKILDSKVKSKMG